MALNCIFFDMLQCMMNENTLTI